MGTVVIGQDSQILQKAEQLLISDGSTVLNAYFVGQWSFLGYWFMSPIVDIFATLAARFVVSNLDKIGFAVYVSVKIGTQVSDYITAQDGSDQSATDEAGDNLIHVGTT